MDPNMPLKGTYLPKVLICNIRRAIPHRISRPKSAWHLPPRPDAAPAPILCPSSPSLGPTWVSVTCPTCRCVCRPQGPARWPTTAPPAATGGCGRPLALLHMCSARSTFETYGWNTCNIRLKWKKRLKHTLETCVYSHNDICNIKTYFCNIQIKALATWVWNIWNTWNICLKHAYRAIKTYATSRWNTSNIRMKHLKHLEHRLVTYATSQIYCNI
jgi:hypothetical protein